jgi:hemerythrin superfamily protein
MQKFLKSAVKHAESETKRLWNKLLLFKKKLRLQLMKKLLSKIQFLRWLLKNRFDRAFKVHLNPV